LPASPAFAHAYHHHGFYRHHAHLAAAQPSCGFLGLQFRCPFGIAAPSPQSVVQAPLRNARVASLRQNSPPVASQISSPVSSFSSMASAQAGSSGVPQSLIDRVIKRESGGNPRAVSHGNYGLMQIRLSTARAMGYTGSAAGLLDPQTNMTYAVRYLAGAYRTAGGNEARAIALYSRGYYYEAKRQGFTPYASAAASPRPQFQYASFMQSSGARQ
jgi:soluble lytic murein transglycosylase-like protein